MDTNSLFHYTKLSTFLEYILPHLAIKFNSIQKTNDPFENSLSISTICSPPKVSGTDIPGLNQQMEYLLASANSTNILQDFKVLCFSQSFKTKDFVTYGYNMPRMWTQYGNNHKGICIEFDKRKLIRKIQDSFKPVYFDKVTYRNDSNLIDYDNKKTYSDEYIKELLIKHRKELFFTKHRDWSGEREYRILYIGQNEYVVFLRNCIKAIYLGLRFNNKYFPLINYYNSSYKLKIYHMHISGLNLYRDNYIEQV